jgi:anti-sigma factor RsiW
MNCRHFREHYSDFADGLLDEQAEVEARRHLALCECCRRFDAAYQAGRGALQSLPVVVPSRGFGRRLQERLRRDCPAEPALRQWSGVAGALLVVTVVLLVAWERGSEAALARRSSGLDTLVLRVPGASPVPTVVREEEPPAAYDEAFLLFPSAADSFVPQTLPSQFTSHASLTAQ